MKQDNMPELNENDWEAIVSEPLPECTLSLGAQKVTMRAIDDTRKIESVFKTPSKMRARLGAINSELPVRATESDLIAMDLIILCVVGKKPTHGQLMKLKRERGMFFQSLKSTAWKYCGLSDTDQAMDDAEGESEGDLP